MLIIIIITITMVLIIIFCYCNLFWEYWCCWWWLFPHWLFVSSSCSPGGGAGLASERHKVPQIHMRPRTSCTCVSCLKSFTDHTWLCQHTAKCSITCPPGDEMNRSPCPTVQNGENPAIANSPISVFEVYWAVPFDPFPLPSTYKQIGACLGGCC